MIEVPVSCGELLDKLTILEIKVQRLVDPAAIANVCREHDLLRERCGTLVDRPDLVPLIDELRRINRALWEIEDEIRDHERRGEFGPSFSALARSVYRTNDRRAAVKRARRCGGPEPRTSALLARALLQAGDRTAAHAVARALAADDAADDALAASGWLLHELAELDQAECVLRRLLAREPRHLQGLVNLGAVCRDQGRVEEAIGWWRRATIADPRSIEARYDLACGRLLAGRWPEGWAGYEDRWRVRRLARPDLRGTPLWDGRPLTRGTLLVHHEQGLGDTLQFVRFLPRLLETVDRVVLVAQLSLRRLLADAPMFAAMPDTKRARLELWAEDEPPAPADAWVPLLSLAMHLGLTLEQAAFGAPYLRAPTSRVQAWRERLAAAPGQSARALRVALVWRGNMASPAERGRSLTASLLAPLLQLAGICWIVLQKDGRDGELPAVGPGSAVELPGHHVDPGPDAFLDSAAILTEVDLLITSDTSMAHLAGALGRPVWLMLRTGPDWRWGHEGERSPWYPSMRLFRQDRPGDWAGVVGRVARSLALPTRHREPVAAQLPTPGDIAVALRAHASGRVEDAARCYRAWLRAFPDDARLLGHLSMAILGGADPAGDEPGALIARAAIRIKAKDFLGARQDLQALLTARPGDADALCDLGVVERWLGRTELAVWFYAQALRLAGNHAGAWLNLGVALDELGRHAEAEHALRRLLELEPGHPAAAMALGMTLLRDGRFEEGAALWEKRLAARLGVWTPPPGLPVWHGGDPRGLRLLLIAEQGYGDAIQFVCYAAVLKCLGAATVVIGCRARIARLLAAA